jgi:Luciferase
MTASEQITAEVTAWPGVTAGPGPRGEFSFRVGRKEIGHLHGDRAAHFGFPRRVWQDLFDEGRIDYHPVFPGKPGWGARAIEDEADVNDVIAMLRLNYERAASKAA